MGHDTEIWVLALTGMCVASMLLRRHRARQTLADLAEQVADAIERFRGGGPGTPMHPSPAGDDALLRKSRKRAEQ